MVGPNKREFPREFQSTRRERTQPIQEVTTKARAIHDESERKRVYELAREIGMSSKELLSRLHALGVTVDSHMATLDPRDIGRIRSALQEQQRRAGQQTSSTVRRRRKPRPTTSNGAGTRSAQRTPAPQTPSAQAAQPAQPVPSPEPQPRAGGRPPESARQPLQWAGMSMRERFERELEEARKRTDARHRAEEARAEEARKEIPVTQPRPGGRPSVGDVIALPAGRPRAPARAQVPAPASKGKPVRRVRIEEARAARPGAPARRSAPAPGDRARAGSRLKRPRVPVGPQRKPEITTPAEHKRVVKVHDTVTVTELARAMSVKASAVLKKLWTMGMMGVTINASVDSEAAGAVAAEFGYEVKNVAFQEQAVLDIAPAKGGTEVSRAPVVTVMGHVDHGKTTLLDAIRSARVAAGEVGGITQHVAAYRVQTPGAGQMVFLDTPGHEAFTAMRARGAQVTDIVVLVVAANDGVMPQTLEALSHARSARVPVVVAVNKIDAPNAQPERARQQLAEHGLIPEEWGGDTLYVDVSALHHQGIDALLEAIGLQADLLDLKADPDRPATGVVIEARLDRARGPMVTVLVQQGTLRPGDIIVAGERSGKVRAMLDDRGIPVAEAGPSTPVAVLGLDGVPEAGELVHVTDERVARQLVAHREEARRKRQVTTPVRMSLESIMGRLQGDEPLELGIVLKADVHGSAEALAQALERLSTPKVRVNVIHAGVGGVTESDVNLARAGGAIIVGFHVRPAGKAAAAARREGVEIRLYEVIYDAVDEVRAAMQGLLPPVRREEVLGKAEVRRVFHIARVGTVAGCMVAEGTIRRGARARIFRDGVQTQEGVVSELKRFQEDAAEVKQGYECGIRLDGMRGVQAGDVIEAYEVVEEPQRL